MTTTLGVTGHRPPKLGGYGIEAKSRLFLFAMGSLREAGPDRVITGMALGWDMTVAEACCALKVPFTAAVPFDGQEARWPTESRLMYSRILKKAESVHIVSPGPYAAYKMQVRNEWMVDHSTKMLALWDGSDGGTANCVTYIEKQQKPLENLWPKWQQFAIRKSAADSGS